MLNKICGKRILYEEYNDCDYDYSIPVSKRIRCASSTSPVRLRVTLLDRLREVFPLTDRQLLDKALEECGDNIDVAIKRLNDLCLGSSEGSVSANRVKEQVEQCGLATERETSAQTFLLDDGTQWVELFVREMMIATSVDDARARAAVVLEALEKSIRASNASADAEEKYQRENMMLKEQIEGLMHDNSIFKRAVQIQHERSKEFDEKKQEVEQLKHLVSQYQEQLRGLEVTNYALSIHLKQAQAQHSSSIPGRFHPDIF